MIRILKHRGIYAIILFAAGISVMGCSGGGGKLVSIIVAPASQTIATGTEHNFSAFAEFSDGTMLDWTTAVKWTSSDESAVTVGNNLGTYGLAKSLASGSTGTKAVITITATDTANHISGTAKLTVVDPVSISVLPNAPFMKQNTSHQFTARAILSIGTSTKDQNFTSLATWTTSDDTIAGVDSKGLVTAKQPGTADISASVKVGPSSFLTSTTALTVTDTSLAYITIDQGDQTISLAATTVPFTATGTFYDTSTQVMTESAHWYSSNKSVATVSNEVGSKGLATLISTGTTAIEAVDPITGKKTSIKLTVDP